MAWKKAIHVLVVLALASACADPGETTRRGHGGPTGDGVEPTAPVGPTCGVQQFNLTRGLPPDMLIVLDKSRSMDDSASGGSGSKWTQVTSALKQTVMSSQGQIKWGIDFFPNDSSCGTSSNVAVPLAASNAAAIVSAIGSNMPGGGTPTATAIQTAASYLGSVGDANPKYILLATDGEPTCGGGSKNTPDDQAAEQAVVDAAIGGVHTFVIGISTDTNTESVLNQMAQNGGEARPGAQKYYPVTSQQDLSATINMIAGQIVSCSLGLTMAPPYPDNVNLLIGGQVVPRDKNHQEGWDYGPGNKLMQLYGSWCQKLQSGMVSDAQAAFGCPPIGAAPPPPRPAE